MTSLGVLERGFYVESTSLVLESQPDWLTLGTHNHDRTEKLRYHADRWVQQELADGAKVRPFRLLGYTGWQAGRVRWGEREDWGLLQLSGDLARAHWDTAVPIAHRVSRVDLAVTVRPAVPDDSLGLRHLDQANAFRLEHPTAARPSFYGNSDGGFTLYIGDRASDWFLRVYNKGAEEREANVGSSLARYADTWRYELEVKGNAAQVTAAACSDAADRSAWVGNTVHAYCRGHGLSPAFTPDQYVACPSGFRRRSDRDTRLRWLRSTVAPTVRWLSESGYRADLLDALGLTGESGATAD